MEVYAPPGASQQASQDEGWSWNPLTMFAKGTTALGQFVDSKTRIGSFNPGIGAFASAAANMIPGMVNAGVQVGNKVLHGDLSGAGSQLGEIGEGMVHGALDSYADLMTFGGLAPASHDFTELVDRVIPGNYQPNTLRDYAFRKDGPGLGGALFNDAANLAMVADGLGALAKAGSIGKIAAEAGRIEKSAMLRAVDERVPTAEIDAFGKAARERHLVEEAARVADAGGDPVAFRQKVETRAKAMDSIAKVRTGAGNFIMPWHALRPFSLEAGRRPGLRERLQTGVQGVGDDVRVSGAETGPRASEGLLGASEGKMAGGGGPEGPAPGFTRLYRGTDAPEAAGQQGSWWTTEAPTGRSGYGHWQYMDVPETSAKRLVEGVKEGVAADVAAGGPGGQPRVGKDVILDPANPAQQRWMETAQEYRPAEGNVLVEAPPRVEGDIPANAATAKSKASKVANWFTTKGQTENVPRAYASYLENAKPTPGWVKAVVDRLPEPAIQLLQWMDGHSQKMSYQTMTRQQQRALAVRARQIENLPEVKALFAKANEVVKMRLPEVTPTVASNIVGQLVRSYVVLGKDMIEQLESVRQAMEEHMPGQGSLLIDSQLGYNVHIPDVLNTPEFRASLYELAEPYKQHRLQASEAMRRSEYVGDKGLANIDNDMVLMTRKEISDFNKANHKLLRALDLEKTRVPKQLEGLAKEKAWTEDQAGRAAETAQAAMETMVEARTDFDRSRYVPDAIGTPAKLAAMADEAAARTLSDHGMTYNPTTGQFLTIGETPGYLVGALKDSVITIPVGEFMRVNPETGRLVGAEMLEHFTHGYQEALQFPNMTIGTWVDDSGLVHIDPTQFLAGPSSRDHVLTLASVRGQQTVKDLHTGDDIAVELNPNTAAYFLKRHQARDLRGKQLRDVIERQIAKGTRSMTQEDIDGFMSFLDTMAVQQHLMHPDLYSSADAFYSKGFKVEFAERVNKAEGALEMRDGTVFGQFVPGGRNVVGGTIRLFQDADLATLFHEGGHLLRALTTREDLKLLERTYGVKGGKWTPEAEEAFVKDFLAKASSGESHAMANLKATLLEAYGEFGGELRPEIESFWQRTLEPAVPGTRAPGFDLSTGERIVGLEGRSELGRTMGERTRQKLNMEEALTGQQQYRRGVEGQKSIDQFLAAAKKKRQADAAHARALDHATKLDEMIAKKLVPAQEEATRLRAKGQDKLDKLWEKLNDPAESRVPPRWQPLTKSAREMAELVRTYPELEPILAEFPKTFGQAVDYAVQLGFDPAYMPDLTPAKVRSLIAGTAQLGNQYTQDTGRSFTSQARAKRTGALERMGAADRSLEALVAGLNQVTQETRTNMVIDWIDRTQAYDLPVDELGRRLPTPNGWVEWDPVRRGMLGVEKVDGEHYAVGQSTKMIPKPVAQAIKEYSGPPPTNPFYRTMRMMTDPWRALMLTMNPGFYVRNFVDAVTMAALSTTSLKSWAEAFQRVRKGEMPAEVTGLSITASELGTPGLVQWPSVADALKVGGPMSAIRHVEQKLHRSVEVADSFARTVVYLEGKKKGKTDMEAAQIAMDALIDYGNLSNTERYWVRSMVPFYSFSKGVTKLVYRMPIDHPITAALMLHVGRWQGEQAVDDQGNPLPEYMQGVVDLPVFGKVNLKHFSRFDAVGSLTTPEGIVRSLQYGLQSVVRSAMGIPAPGTKAGVKVDAYGRLVPDVKLQDQLMASFTEGPQGALVDSGDWKRFFGLPQVTSERLSMAGQRNVLAEGELAAADEETRQKAASSQVDTMRLQQNLRSRLNDGTALSIPTSPTGGQMFSIEQLQAAVDQATEAQQAKAKLTRASSGTSRRRAGRRSRRVRSRLRQGYGRNTRLKKFG